MRSRTDSRTGKTSPAPLEKHFREIVVGNGRSQEPYIIAFHYASDNVSGSPLGTLFGFFEVEIHDQDAAYIVNFLASVAKKEYFANPRRSPVESFEAALHKINVALAEIVKHGNVSWLGHLHGAIGSVADNSLLFSVTGEGELYLARGEMFRSISTGLADASGEPHPLKTFTEISSGELFDADFILAFSPSVWSLFSAEDLQRNLSRLGPADFEQFLRTALVNELPIAAVTLLTCSAPVEIHSPTQVKEERKPTVSLSNVWSGKPFDEALKNKRSSTHPERETKATKTVQDEYVDQKTGHIYVQAPPEVAFEEHTHHWKEHWEMFAHSLEKRLRDWHVSAKKIGRRTRRGGSLVALSITNQTSQIHRFMMRRGRGVKRALADYQQKRLAAKAEQKQQAIISKKATTITSEELNTPLSEPDLNAHLTSSPEAEAPHLGINNDISTDRVRRFFQREPHQEIPLRETIRQQWAHWSGHANTRFPLLSGLKGIPTALSARSLRVMRCFRTSIDHLQIFLSTRTPHQKWLALGIILFITLGLISLIAWPEEQTAPEERVTSSSTPPLPAFPPANEPQSRLLTDSRSVYPGNGSPTIALLNLNDTPILITTKSIVNLKTQESTTAPEPVRLAAAMDDLNALFILGESDTLYLWSITTKKFEQNTLPRSTGTTIDALGAYLTYLYALDQKTGIIQRYPRAEGGFGTPTNWLKESVSLAPLGTMAVHENIALTFQNKEPVLFSRGRRSAPVFSGTTTLVTADILAFDQKTGDLLVLDRANKRIIRWSATGTLLNQYFHESFGAIESFSVSPDETEIFVSHQGATTAWRIP